MNSITSSYYVPPASSQQGLYPIAGTLGFLINIPATPPVTGPWYFGENPVLENETRELVLEPFPETTAVGGAIPYLSETLPLVDMNHQFHRFQRGKHTYRV